MRILIAFLLFGLVGLFVSPVLAAEKANAERPNIVWLIVEDMSADFGCYGETAIKTPNVDALAKGGVKFTNAVVTAPVCSACRSALITGMYQTSIGAHHHRSGRGELKIQLPDKVRLVPELFQEAGYLTNNLTFQDFVRPEKQLELNAAVKTAKTDYNFEWNADAYDATHWARRKEGQPFFAQVQLRGGKLRGHGDGDAWPAKAKQTLGSNTPTDAFTLPPYLPADPVILRDWAQYLDAVRYTDWEVGQIVERLREAGELDDTYIFFITDHGISHVRNKQFCYEGGVHIPLIVRGPGIEAGTVRYDPVEHIDLAAASLALAGVEAPQWMQARDILADDYSPRGFVFSARDRCDETVDHIRSARTQRYKYIRNFLPDRPYLQPNVYKDGKPIQQTMRRLHAAGELNEAQAQIMASSRPPEELYDLERDPHELHNLADDPEYADMLLGMRKALDRWIKQTGDRGQQPESQAMYDSDMAAYLKGRQDERAAQTRRNIALMKKLAAEGK
ncbi:MAG: sulfatase [Pirellulaceae bacterium]